jgi:hypothetical protein
MRRHPKTRHHWTETEATAVLADFAASGLTLAEFCNQRGRTRCPTPITIGPCAPLHPRRGHDCPRRVGKSIPPPGTHYRAWRWTTRNSWSRCGVTAPKSASPHAVFAADTPSSSRWRRAREGEVSAGREPRSLTSV